MRNGETFGEPRGTAELGPSTPHHLCVFEFWVPIPNLVHETKHVDLEAAGHRGRRSYDSEKARSSRNIIDLESI
jgi:hypothetical protein